MVACNVRMHALLTVTSAPSRVHSLRKGKFPTVVRGARNVFPRICCVNRRLLSSRLKSSTGKISTAPTPRAVATAAAAPAGAAAAAAAGAAGASDWAGPPSPASVSTLGGLDSKGFREVRGEEEEAEGFE